MFLAIIPLRGAAQNDWKKIEFENEKVHDCVFFDEQNGYVITDLGNLWKTTNGGFNWTSSNIYTCNNCFFTPYNIWMFTTALGKIEGAIKNVQGSKQIILSTTDGGTSWTAERIDTNFFSDIDFKSTTHGYAIDYIGKGFWPWQSNETVVKTTDGGREWKILQQHSGVSGLSIVFRNSDVGFKETSYQEPYEAYTFLTKDGGNNWEKILEYTFWSVSHSYGTEWWGCFTGPSTLYKSTDDGLTWNKVFDWKNDSLPSFQNMFFLNSNVGYYNTTYPETKNNYGRTTNGGNSWVLGHLGDSGSFVSKIIPVTENRAFAISREQLYVTQTGGGFGQIHTNPLVSEISLRTNPVFDRLELIIDERTTGVIEIFDALGRRIVNKELDVQTLSVRMDIRHFAPGLYIAKIGTRSLPFIKF